jgi:hypothetical protein
MPTHAVNLLWRDEVPKTQCPWILTSPHAFNEDNIRSVGQEWRSMPTEHSSFSSKVQLFPKRV